MDCIICHEEKPRKTFNIKQKLTADFDYELELNINKDICEECFKPESIGDKIGVSILQVNVAPYAKDFERAFWEKSDIKRDDIYTLYEIVDILIEKKIRTTTVADKRDTRGIAKAWVDMINPSMRFDIEMPTADQLYSQRCSVVKKKDLEVLLNFPKAVVDGEVCMNYKCTSKHKLSKHRIEELFRMGYATFGKNGEPKFGNNLKEKKRICIRCGEIKDWEGFRVSGQNNVWECLDCESIRYKKYYAENHETMLERAKTPKAKKRRRELEKNPKYIYARRIRGRLKRYMKTALAGSNPCKWNKNTEITNREFVELLEDLSEEWMSEHNYGSGLNLDHEGTWHIDHVIPLCLWEEYKHINPFYNKEAEKDSQIGPNHWTNLRPLCAQENMTRSSRDLDLKEVQAHYEKLKLLYPKRNIGVINV